MFEFVPQAERAGLKRGFTKFAKQKDAVALSQLHFLHKNGSILTIEGVRTNLLHEPAIQAIVVNFHDITERSRMDQELRASHTLLNKAQAIGHIGSWELDIADNRLTWSDEVYRLFGVLPQDFGGTNEYFLEFVHPDDRPAVENAYSEAVRDGRDVYEIEHRILRRDTGEVRFVYEKCENLKDPSGKIVRSLGMVQDITERKQVEEALRESEERYRGLFENSPVSLWEEDFSYVKSKIEELKRQGITDFREFLLNHPDELLDWINGIKILDVNQATLAMERAASKEQLIGSLKQVVRIDASIGFLDEFVSIAEGRNDFTWEGINYTLDGERLNVSLKWLAEPGFEDSLGKVLVSLIDITERKKLEQTLREYNLHLEEKVDKRTQELRQAQEQLVRKEKLAVLGQLAGSVGHELRNPLGVINTSIYYLKLVEPEASEKIKEHLAMIEQEVHTADKIISDLLDFARGVTAERESTSVAGLVKKALERFPAPASVDVKIDLPEDLPDVFVDPTQLVQVLGNLVVNAYQAMKAGGRLTISARRVVYAATEVNQKEMLEIVMTDTGQGIKAENMQKLFEPLFTTKTRGIGLGLAVCKKLIEANDGRIEVISEVGKGSAFTLIMPVIDEVNEAG